MSSSDIRKKMSNKNQNRKGSVFKRSATSERLREIQRGKLARGIREYNEAKQGDREKKVEEDVKNFKKFFEKEMRAMQYRIYVNETW